MLIFREISSNWETNTCTKKETKKKKKKKEKEKKECSFIAGNPRQFHRRLDPRGGQKYSLRMESTSQFHEIAFASFDRKPAHGSEIHGFVKRPADKTTNNSNLSFLSFSLSLSLSSACTIPPFLIVRITAAGTRFFFQKRGGDGRTRYKGWPSVAEPWSYTEINNARVGTRSWLISHQLERSNYYRLVKFPRRHPRLTAFSFECFTRSGSI